MMTMTPSQGVQGNFAKLTQEVGEWSRYNFGDNNGLNEIAPLLGVGEEILDELLTAQNEADRKDAYADAMIFLADFYSRTPLSSGHLLFDQAFFLSANPGGKHVDPAVKHIYLGKCMHHCLKRRQKIRGYTNDRVFSQKLQPDADALFWGLCNSYCKDHYEFFQNVVDRTWVEVSKRDWRKKPDTAAEVVEKVTVADPPLPSKGE